MTRGSAANESTLKRLNERFCKQDTFFLIVEDIDEIRQEYSIKLCIFTLFSKNLGERKQYRGDVT